MDTKRLITALALSLVVIIGYPKVYKLIYPPQEITAPSAPLAEATTQTTLPQGSSGSVAAGSKTASTLIASAGQNTYKPVFAEKETEIKIETPLYKATLTNLGGGVKSWELKKYKENTDEQSPLVNISYPLNKINPFGSSLDIQGYPKDIAFKPSTNSIKIAEGEEKKLVLTWFSSTGFGVEKIITFNGDNYTIATEFKVINNSTALVNGAANTSVTGLLGSKGGMGSQNYHSGPIRMVDRKIERQKKKVTEESGRGIVDWLGTEDKYFLTALIPSSSLDIDWKSVITITDSETEAGNALVTMGLKFGLNPGETKTTNYRAYIGPKEMEYLKTPGVLLEKSVEFGMFQFLARPFLSVLKFLQGYVANYGLAIIILTIGIKIIFYPLTKSSLASMKKLKDLKPQMDALKKKLKGDKSKMNKELMALYKRHKVNPVGGCMPMVLQIPVFIGLYEVLGVAIELRHAPFFLWLGDLSAMDPYYITPVIMGISMFIQQKMTPTAMDPVQEKIMLAMPIFMTFMFLKFPSGLVLYWLTNNCLTIAQHYHIHKSDSKSVSVPLDSDDAIDVEATEKKKETSQPKKGKGKKKALKKGGADKKKKS